MPQNARKQFAKGFSLCFAEGKASPGTNILIALSGGADSVALLHLLHESAREGGFSLAACHVNHGIRGKEAKRDEDFCRDLCNRFHIPFRAVSIDVPAAAKNEKTGLEETARNLRYAALQQVCLDLDCHCIATAHHADDHLETVLFHLARGSGTAGMLGIAPRRENIIRPLLHCTKDDILRYLSAIGADYCTDSTNFDTDYTRNYIRHVLLPGMRHINPRAAEAALTMSDILRRDELYLQSQLPTEMPPLCELAALPDPLLSRLLRKQYALSGGKGGSEAHFRDLIKLVRFGKTGQSLSLPGGITARRNRDELVFSPTVRRKKMATVTEKHPVFLPNDTVSSDEDHIILIQAEENTDFPQKIHNLSTKTPVSSAILTRELFWRTRQPGDTVRFGAMTRQIKKILMEKGLPPSVRDNLPIVCDQNGPLWVPGFPVRDDLAPQKGEEMLYLVFSNRKKA